MKRYFFSSISTFLVFIFFFSCAKKNPTGSDNQFVFEEEGTIGSAGGTVQITDPNSKINGTYINIPNGALSSNQKISITDASSSITPLTDTTAIVVHFEPIGLVFKEPVEIGLPYKQGTDYENIRAFFIDTAKSEIIQLPTLSIDEEAGIITTSTIHFSYFFAGKDGVYADIDFNIVNSKFKVGVRVFGKKYNYNSGKNEDYGLTGIWTKKVSWPVGIFNVKDLVDKGDPLIGDDVISYFDMELKRKVNYWIDPILETKKLLVKRVGNHSLGFGAEVYLEDFSSTPIIAFGSLDSDTRERWFNGSTLIFNFDSSIDASEEYYVDLTWGMENDENASWSNGRFTDLYKFTTFGDDDYEPSNVDLDINNNYINDNDEPQVNIPTVSISQPSNDQHFTVGDNVNIQIDASDPDGIITSVELYINNTLYSYDTSSPYQFSWDTNNLSEGSYNIYIVASWDVGDITTTIDDEITIFLDSPAANQLPIVSITSPSDNEHLIHGENITIQADASDTDGFITRVEFYIDFIPLGFDTSYPYQYDWTVSGIVGSSHLLRVKAIDNKNAEATSFITVYIDDPGSNNNTPTASFVVSPLFGSTSTTFNFDANGCTDDEDATTALQVRWDWENDGNWDTNYSATKTSTHQYQTEGSKTIKLEVKDLGGLTNTTIKQVSVSNGGESETGSVTDIDGNIYQTVKIGDQWWAAENLKVTHYRNGDPIPNINDNSEWGNLDSGAFCSYDNDDSNIITYGLLYNWYAVNDPRGLAPSGWHVPTDEEWKQMEMYLGMSQSEADGQYDRGTDEGSKLKSTVGWYSPSWFGNGNGNNESGFSALPGGFRFYTGTFWPNSLTAMTYIWTSSSYDSNIFARNRHLLFSSTKIDRRGGSKRRGASVRCIKD